MNLSIVPFSDEDKDLWNEWITSNPWSSFYHLWEWGDVLCKTYQYQRYYFAVKRGPEILGVLPLMYIKSNILGNKLVSLPFAEYGGPLLVGSIDSSDIESTLKLMIKLFSKLTEQLKVDYVELRHPNHPLPLTGTASVFTRMRRYVTFRIDLAKSESELWHACSRRCRKAIRKPMKLGVKIKEVNSDLISHYYNLHLDTESRHGSPPHSEVFFRNVFDLFAEKRLRMMLAVFDGKVVGGTLSFHFMKKLYGFNSVIDRKYANLNPTNLQLWHLITWAAQNDFEVFDLGQTRPEDRGICLFKRGWGGREVPLESYVFTTSSAEVPDPLQRKYMVLSRLWSLLPQALARRVGPSLIRSIAL